MIGHPIGPGARRRAALLVATLAAGCAATPNSIIEHPTTARPAPPRTGVPAPGAIYSVATHRPLFEDRRARLVGDTLTVTINERTSAGKLAASSGSKTGSVATSVPVVSGLPFKTLQDTELAASTANKFEDKGAVTSSNNFTGNITVTVIEVLPNGNLLVAGEKQVALDKGAEFIRFSGVVNPETIGVGNVVSSTQVADVRAEYRTNSRIDQAEVSNWLARFFLSLLPF